MLKRVAQLQYVNDHLYMQNKKQPKSKLFRFFQGMAEIPKLIHIMMKTTCSMCYCLNLKAESQVSCGHYYCSHCLHDRAYHKTQGTFDERLDQISCVVCEQMIPRSDFARILGELNINKHKEGLEVFPISEPEIVLPQEETKHTFSCGICMDTKDEENCIKFNCDHKLCEDCAYEYLENMIGSAMVSEDQLICPYDKCKTSINVYQVEHACKRDPSLIDKFYKFLIKKLESETGAAEDEVLKVCNNCEYMAFIPKDWKEYECRECHHKVCLMCGEKVHEGIDCEKFKQWKMENDNAEKLMAELIANEAMQKCPECGIFGVLVDGCKYMYCYTPNCKKNNVHFCYLCGIKVIEKWHYSHYLEEPFGQWCHNAPNPAKAPIFPEPMPEGWVAPVEEEKKEEEVKAQPVPVVVAPVAAPVAAPVVLRLAAPIVPVAPAVNPLQDNFNVLGDLFAIYGEEPLLLPQDLNPPQVVVQAVQRVQAPVQVPGVDLFENNQNVIGGLFALFGEEPQIPVREIRRPARDALEDGVNVIGELFELFGEEPLFMAHAEEQKEEDFAFGFDFFGDINPEEPKVVEPVLPKPVEIAQQYLAEEDYIDMGDLFGDF